MTQDRFKDVARTVSWKKVDADHYEVRVQYSDTTYGNFYYLTVKEYKILVDKWIALACTTSRELAVA